MQVTRPRVRKTVVLAGILWYHSTSRFLGHSDVKSDKTVNYRFTYLNGKRSFLEDHKYRVCT